MIVFSKGENYNMKENWFNKTVTETLESLTTNANEGLKSEEIEERRKKYGFNELKAKKKKVNVDINGNEGPNIGGRDMFELYITPDGEAADCPSGNCEDPSTATCTSSALGTDCYGVLSEANWQMNY